MSNIWKLFTGDVRRLFANVVSCIITIGLVVMPSIFAWYNLIACWDVFDNTGNLTVAVANDDEGYESDLMPLRVNIGDMVVSALRANDQIGWVVTTSADAVDGTASGKYYAAVVIPKEFSRDMLRFYTDDSEHAQITYYENEKKNAISPKITTTGADTVSSEVNTAFAQTLTEVMLSVAESISNYSDKMDVDGQIAALAGHVRSMADDMDRVSHVVEMYAGALRNSQNLLDDSAELISSVQTEAKAVMDKAGGAIDGLADAPANMEGAKQKMEEALDAAQTSFDKFKQALENEDFISLIGDEAKQRIEQLVADSQAKMQEVRDDYERNLKPNLNRLATDSKALAADSAAAIKELSAMASSVFGVVDSAHGILDGAISKISDVSSGLSESSVEMRELADGIMEALASKDVQQLKNLLTSDTQSLSKAMAAPVGIERIAVFSSENFGSAMAPFYTALAIFIGSLLILVVVKPKVSNIAQHKLKDPKPRQMLVGRFGCMACLSLAQTTLMGVGNIFFLQVQAVHPWLLMLIMWVAGLVFTFIIYVLVLAFANLGKAIAVCLLIVQVTGCGGSYPLQILPEFVQWVSPFLPATHAVNAMRAAMFGVYQGDFWMQMGALVLFLVPAALIGFVLRKPFERFMKWYVRTVESTKIIG
ncbi:YhgE/Pip domain-containing protein [Adlercreutzia sp. ZJ304]|uniref:YhgE/Pip domain-containing protein n=1 Tax=Adlercreutzia sp. ZJ304 TaxID=2709791 RepID=UPI0013ED6213|nr:YhgE/Pip domain-containing protein [Adlercreutzia sp. ZJ304]